MVHRDDGIRAAELLSHVAILDVPRLSQAAIHHRRRYGSRSQPGAEAGHILKNALDLCRFLGYETAQGGGACALWKR
ncbi:MAG: hypothetical protein ACLUJG_03090 [Lawsonibacter sp.]